MDVQIPADQVVLDSQPAPAPDAQAAPEIPSDQVVLDSDKYSTPGQTAAAHAEAVGRGLAGPVSTLTERLLGVPSEDIKGREEANPEAKLTEAATFGVSALAGVGEAELVARAGAEAARAAEAAGVASKLARSALRTGVETAIMQSGDEAHKMIVGDPASASDVALAAGIGLIGGAALESVPTLWRAGKEAAVNRWLRTAGDAAVEARPSLATEAAKKAGKGLFGIPESATESYLKDVKGVQAASDDLWTVADKLPKAVSDTSDFSSQFSRAARETLSDVRDVPSEGIIERLKSVPGKEAESIVEKLEQDLAARNADVSMSPDRTNLTEREVRDAMDQLSRDVNFEAVLPTAEKAALRRAYGEMNEVLRAKNPAYAEAMGLSAKNVTLKQNLVQKLRLVKDYSSEFGYKATDTTVSRLKDLARSDKRDVADILTSLKQLGHDDLAAEVKNTLTKQAFQKDATRGGRLTVLGGTTGAGIGHASGIPGAAGVGAAAGSWLGAMADRYGPQAYFQVLGKMAERAPEALGLNRLKGDRASLPLARAILSQESSASGARAAVDYTAAVVAGQNRVTKAVRAAMERGGLSLVGLKADDKAKERVGKAAAALQDRPQDALAQQNDLARHMPDNAASLVAAKTRALTYLTSLKPKPPHGLPFDDTHVDLMAERRYQRALGVATSPLSVLYHVQKGTLEPEHVADLHAMYPSLHAFMRKAAFSQVVDVKHVDRKPNYSVRQGMSMLMGEPLDSTFLPSNMQAAQLTHLAKSSSQPRSVPAPKPKSIKSSLSKVAEGHATSDQAAAARSQGGY